MTSENRTRYTKEQKDAILKRMMPPQNESVKSITEDLEISKQTLYKWRKQARSAG
ncbi:transposase [Planococcus antarcticus]|uniref:transposase n=1 Tax=Planococcus antarcticus TaxID=161360 RepID=UPI0009F33E90|nr:transposase [Planococcus antarcticus]